MGETGEEERQPTPAEFASAQFATDFDSLLKQPAFRRWLWYVIDDPGLCGSHRITADVASPNQTYLDEGRRSIGVSLTVGAQRVAPLMYLRMLTEAMNDRFNRVVVPKPEAPAE
jgi:hypothetical protein